MRKILIVSFSPISRDPRVMRQIRLLEKCYELTVMGYGEQPAADIQYIELTKTNKSFFRRISFALKLSLKLFENYYWNTPPVREALHKIPSKNFDLIIANDVSALPLALRIGKDGKVLLDAHEYAPRQFEDRWLWKLFFKGLNHYLCKQYLPRVDGMVTVCEGLSNEYLKQYGVRADIVHNAPIFQNLSPTPVDEHSIKLIHHGLAAPSRHLELTIELMGLLDERFALDLMLIEAVPGYLQRLKDLCKNNPRIRFVPPVSMVDICKAINKYDIGVFLLPPVNFNYQNALPNKFFEFIQANLAIAIGPSPEMAKLVEKYHCGVIASSFEPSALANALNVLGVEEIRNFKLAANIAAQDLCYATSGEKMLRKIESLLSN